MRSATHRFHGWRILRCAFAACSLLTCPIVRAESDRLPAIEIVYSKFVLSNGLTLIVHEDRKAPLVAINVTYKVGSRDERPGRTGFAHLFEHLMFNGSEHLNDEFFRPLQAAGASNINGNTTVDRTTFYETVPTGALDFALWLESDRMGHLLGAVDQAKLDGQRGVVQNEKRQAESGPYGKREEIFASQTYPAGHPYSWTTIGSMTDLNTATLDDVKDWFHAYYGAANAVLVISGDVTASEVKSKVEQYFGEIPSGPAVNRLQQWPAPLAAPKRMVLRERIPQTRVQRVWNVPGRTSRDTAMLRLAAAILELDRTSGRLYERLVRTDRTATSIATDLYEYDLGSTFSITAVVKPNGDSAAVERVIDEELQRLRDLGPTKQELDLVKSTMVAALARSTESVASKASLLSRGELAIGAPDFFFREQVDWLRDATPKDVQQALRRWLTENAFTLEMRANPAYSVTQTGADRSTPPTIEKAEDPQFPPLRRVVLPNGLKVALVERRGAPVVTFNVVVDAGFAADPSQQRGTARLTFDLLTQGTRKRSAAEISRRGYELGADLTAASTLETSFVQLNALSTRLEESLELLSDVLLHPSFPEAEVKRVKEKALAAIEQQRVSPVGIGYEILPRLVYGEEQAYANLTGNGTPQSVTALARDDVRSFYEQWVRPDNATLLIVGDTSLAQIQPLLTKYLGSWERPLTSPPRKRIDVAVRRDRARVFLVDLPGSEQSVIRAAHAAPPRSDDAYVALRTANAIIGGSFLSRLNLSLREEKNWSYGVASEWQAAKAGGLFAVTAPVQTDKTAEAMTEVLRVLTEVGDASPPTVKELDAARDEMLKSVPAQLETVSGLISSYGVIVSHGLDDDYWMRLADRTRALTLEELARATQMLVHPDALTWLVVGDLSTIEGSIRALKLGEVQVLAADGAFVR